MGRFVLKDFFDGGIYNVLFRNSSGYRRIIGKAKNKDEVFEVINKFLDDHDYKSYYTRISNIDGELVLDAGSHTEFFIVKEQEEDA